MNAHGTMAEGLPTDDAPMLSARQALVGQLEKAAAGLTDPKRTDLSIHAIRKQLKRARATLRLLRDCLGEALYRRENSLLRDTARPLTPVRDAKVLFETLRHHDPHKGAANPGAFVRGFYAVLGERRRAAKSRLRNSDLLRAAAGLHAIARRAAALPERQLAQATASMALKSAYKSARKAFARACSRRTDERLHEWRKQTKYFANEIEVVLGFCPKRFAKSCKRAGKLAEQLGDDHDLALLTEEILRHAKGAHAPSRDDSVQELLGHLAGRRRALQRKAFRLGRRLYSDKARRYEL
jgi:CHAD domain-containing protein